MMEDGTRVTEIGFGLDWQPKIRRRVADPVAKKAGWRDADNGEGPSLDEDCGTYD